MVGSRTNNIGVALDSEARTTGVYWSWSIIENHVKAIFRAQESLRTKNPKTVGFHKGKRTSVFTAIVSISRGVRVNRLEENMSDFERIREGVIYQHTEAVTHPSPHTEYSILFHFMLIYPMMRSASRAGLVKHRSIYILSLLKKVARNTALLAEIYKY